VGPVFGAAGTGSASGGFDAVQPSASSPWLQTHRTHPFDGSTAIFDEKTTTTQKLAKCDPRSRLARQPALRPGTPRSRVWGG
jgi:hypothetical protein